MNPAAKRSPQNLLVTGGCGFIGGNFIRYLFNNGMFTGNLVNVDKLTYAGNPFNLIEIEESFGRRGENRYFFHHGDICDFPAMARVFEEHRIDAVVHFAAESHVDRSIHGPGDFIRTNINGAFNLLEVARKCWHNWDDVLFHHVSTDEVYGSLGDTGRFSENSPYDPHSPYSASKASSDHLVKAYFHTYHLPVAISNCSNNYGPLQFPEKLIPLMILNAFEGKALPVYGDGKNVRDWLYVTDHCEAIWRIVEQGVVGETYNVGGECERANLEVVQIICDKLEALSPASGNKALREKGIASYRDLIAFVADRPGHDRRYAINCEKIRKELGWAPSTSFEEGLSRTVRWYLDHPEWVARIRSGDYKNWLDKNYTNR